MCIRDSLNTIGIESLLYILVKTIIELSCLSIRFVGINSIITCSTVCLLYTSFKFLCTVLATAYVFLPKALLAKLCKKGFGTVIALSLIHIFG